MGVPGQGQTITHEHLRQPVLRVVPGGSQPAISSVHAKAMLAERILPEMREKGLKAVAGLNSMLENNSFGKQEEGFMKSLLALKGSISSLLNGTLPEFKQHDSNFTETRLLSHNHDVKMTVTIEDGGPVLCPEMENVISIMLYTMNAHESGRVGLFIGKESDENRQIIIISGASIKNLGPEVMPAAKAAVELLGCKFQPNGASVTMFVPLQPNGQTTGVHAPI